MNPLDDARFDAAMRARYQAAAGALPPRLRAQLRPAQATPALAWWRQWTLPAGLATAAAVAVLALAMPRLHVGGAAHAPQLAAGSLPTTVADPLADPEFYAWLASDDAQLLAME